MKVLPKLAVSCSLAMLLLVNRSFCLAANQVANNSAADNIPPANTLISAMHNQINSDLPINPTENANLNQFPKVALSAVANDTAQQLAIMPLVEELQSLRSRRGSEAIEIERLQLKQQLTESVLIATLQVRDVTARIEKEISQLNRMLEYLEARRDKALKINTMSNAFALGAVMETGQAGEMKVNEIPGEITELVGGGIIMLLSAWSLHVQSGGKQAVPPKPNMLSKAFNYPTNADSEYPQLVWKYLNRVPINDLTKRTRLQALFAHWRRYEILGNKKSPANSKRTAQLTNSGEQRITNIDLIGDQLALLSDLKAEIYQLDRDLLELLLNTQAL
jgi:hypothetical protein